MKEKLKIICLAHQLSDLVFARYRSLARIENAEVILFVDQRECDLTYAPADVIIKAFDLCRLEAIGYRPIRKSLVPGSNHFPIIEYAADSDEEFTWCVEYDVNFNGVWQTLFDAHADSDADLLTTQVAVRENDPHWYWWNSFVPPKTPAFNLTDIAMVRSFNPIYRISQRAARYLRSQFHAGWMGHHEVSMATLLVNAGFRVEDIGGTGSFTRPKNRNKWYQTATFNHRQTKLSPLDMQTQDMLFHPMKSRGCAADTHFD